MWGSLTLRRVADVSAGDEATRGAGRGADAASSRGTRPGPDRRHGARDTAADSTRYDRTEDHLTQGCPTEHPCAELDVGVLNAAIFNSGILAQRYPDAGARFEYAATSREVLERARTLAQICEAHGTSLPAAALAFAAAPPP